MFAIMKVISRKNLPSRFPTLSTVVTALALDYWNAPQWLWGAMVLLFLLMWTTSIVMFVKEKQVDVLPESSDGEYTQRKSKFEQRMDAYREGKQ